MELFKYFIDVVLHVDRHLNIVIQNCGGYTYLLLFIIVFAETGLVVTPFLPGDSLLFATGAFAAMGSLNLGWLLAVLAVAAVIGDSVNYAVGKVLGEKMFYNHNSRWLKREYLERTHRFYEKHGGKTIVLARFVPIVRTFAPFVAGVGKMNYFYFFFYNVAGALLWVALFVGGGYWFGNIPVIKKNFSLVIFVIIVLSILPAVVEVWRHKRRKPASAVDAAG